MKHEDLQRNYKAELFYYARDSLLSQGRKSISVNGNGIFKQGRYRCAVGFLMDLTLFDKLIQKRKTSFKPMVAAISVKMNVPVVEVQKLYDQTFFHALMMIHDHHDVNRWPESFEGMRKLFNIQPQLDLIV